MRLWKIFLCLIIAKKKIFKMLELIFCSNCNKSFDFYKTNYICNHCNFLNPLDLSKTNYYNYLSLLPIYNLNQQDLENNYLTLSIKVHPDNFIKKSQTEKINSFSHIVYLNESYNILKDDYKRIEYLYLLKTNHKILTEEDKNTNEINLEFFELNLQIEQEQNKPQLLILQKNLLAKQQTYLLNIEQAFNNANYQIVKSNYIYLKYLNNIILTIKLKLT